MRLNKLLMVALAGMTMLSCSNNDEPDGNPSNENKKVVLKLEGIKSAKTRSTDTPTESTGNHTITVNKVAVVFYDNTAKKVMMVDEVEASEQDWTDLTGTDGKSYSNVPASVSHVMVVGNASEKLAGEIHEGQDVEAIKNYTYSLAKENQPVTDNQDTKSNVTLYGDAGITAVSGEEDTYEAKVNINPLVSRFEVKSVGCKFPIENANYKKLVLKGIGLVHYYSEATIASQADDGTITTNATVQKMPVDGTIPAVENGIFDPEFEGDITGDGSYKFCDANETEWAWSFDVLPSNVEISGTNEQRFKDDEQKDYTFAYNFFPQDGADELYRTPNICAWVEAYETKDGTPDEDHTVVTSTMLKDGQPLVPKAGEIYQLDYIFEEGDIDEWIPTITVKVNVTVAKWSIITVTPEF